MFVFIFNISSLSSHFYFLNSYPLNLPYRKTLKSGNCSLVGEEEWKGGFAEAPNKPFRKEPEKFVTV